MSSLELVQLAAERTNYNNLFDPVTGLPAGWMLLIDRLEVALARCRRTGLLVAVFVLDNPRVSSDDGFGLVGVVRRLRDQIRSDDTLARIGKDRLVVVCTDVADDAEAACLARHVINDAGVSCSLGVALGGMGESSDGLLERGIRSATAVMADELTA
jgi:GGDEF domain-containing protein